MAWFLFFGFSSLSNLSFTIERKFLRPLSAQEIKKLVAKKDIEGLDVYHELRRSKLGERI